MIERCLYFEHHPDPLEEYIFDIYNESFDPGPFIVMQGYREDIIELDNCSLQSFVLGVTQSKFIKDDGDITPWFLSPSGDRLRKFGNFNRASIKSIFKLFDSHDDAVSEAESLPLTKANIYKFIDETKHAILRPLTSIHKCDGNVRVAEYEFPFDAKAYLKRRDEAYDKWFASSDSTKAHEGTVDGFFDEDIPF